MKIVVKTHRKHLSSHGKVPTGFLFGLYTVFVDNILIIEVVLSEILIISHYFFQKKRVNETDCVIINV